MNESHKPYIFIIEDEAAIAESVQFAIERAGMRCGWASNGQAGLKAVREGVDLVLLDVGLPDVDGFELLKSIRQSSEVPVVMLTAQQEEIDRVLGLELGADDYVGKPFSLRELIARIKAILKRAEPSTAVIEHVSSESPFTFDETRQIYQLNGMALELTSSEQKLLSALLAQPERVFSREQLIAHIWSDHHPSDARVIDTHVKSLRSKLRALDAERVYIITHRGLGYSLSLSD